MPEQFKYRAFISYSHRDRSWGDWLHKALESYRVPTRLIGGIGRDSPIPPKLFPIFRDREELPAQASLTDQIKTALEQSAYLIVICSPSAASSRWVNEEILLFKRLGREDRILTLIVKGEPNATDKQEFTASEECFPEALKFRLGQDNRLTSERVEPVAADARPQGDGRENAKLKLIAGLLGIGFDALKQREIEAARRAARRYRAVAGAMVLLAIGAGVAAYIAHSDSIKAERNAATAVGLLALGELKDDAFDKALATLATEASRTGVLGGDVPIEFSDAVWASLMAYRPRRALKGGPFWEAVWSPDGSSFLTLDKKGLAEVHDLRTDSIRAIVNLIPWISLNDDVIYPALACSAHCSRIAAYYTYLRSADLSVENYGLHLWDTQTGELITSDSLASAQSILNGTLLDGSNLRLSRPGNLLAIDESISKLHLLIAVTGQPLPGQHVNTTSRQGSWEATYEPHKCLVHLYDFNDESKSELNLSAGKPGCFVPSNEGRSTDDFHSEMNILVLGLDEIVVSDPVDHIVSLYRVRSGIVDQSWSVRNAAYVGMFADDQASTLVGIDELGGCDVLSMKDGRLIAKDLDVEIVRRDYGTEARRFMYELESMAARGGNGDSTEVQIAGRSEEIVDGTSIVSPDWDEGPMAFAADVLYRIDRRNKIVTASEAPDGSEAILINDQGRAAQWYTTENALLLRKLDYPTKRGLSSNLGLSSNPDEYSGAGPGMAQQKFGTYGWFKALHGRQQALTLSFDSGERFLAAFGDRRIRVWAVPAGEVVLDCETSKNIIGYYFVNGEHFALLNDLALLDLKTNRRVISKWLATANPRTRDFDFDYPDFDLMEARNGPKLPPQDAYAIKTTPGSPWAIFLPEQGNPDMDIRVVNLFNEEKLHLNAKYEGFGPAALSLDATRMAVWNDTGMAHNQTDWVDIWNPETGAYVARAETGFDVQRLHLFPAQRAVVVVLPPMKGSSRISYFDQDSGLFFFSIPAPTGGLSLDEASSPAGRYFAVAAEDGVYLYRGSRAPDLLQVLNAQVDSMNRSFASHPDTR